MPEVATDLAGLLAWARGPLAAAGIADPDAEALRLWSGLWRIPPAEAYLGRRDEVAPERAARFEGAVGRRSAGEPLAYVVGWTGFRHLTLATDRRALIPRPETEGVVDLLERQRTGAVADIGTGTGCLAIALGQEGSFAEVHAVDTSAAALALAEGNARAAGVRVRFHQGDLVAPLAGMALDALVSNPPYLTTAEHATLDPSVRAWEPAQALASGADGTEHTRRLLDEGRSVVRPGGWIVLEVDCTRAEGCAAVARHFGWVGVEVHRDLFGRERYLTARRSEG